MSSCSVVNRALSASIRGISRLMSSLYPRSINEFNFVNALLKSVSAAAIAKS